MTTNYSRRGFIALILAMISWGLGNPFADMALDAFAVSQLLVLEIGFGFVIVAMFLAWRRRKLKINWKLAAALGLLEPGFTYLFGNIGYSRGTVSTGLIVMASEVFFVAIIGAVFLKEFISPRMIFSIILGFGGVVVAVSEVRSGGEDSWFGVFAFTLSAIFASLYVVVARIYAVKENVVDLVFGQLFVGTIFAFIIFVLSGSNFPESNSFELKYWLAAFCSGLFGAALPFILFNYASSLVATKYSALALNAIPIVGIGFGGLLGRGLPTPIQALGGLIVVLSLYVGTRGDEKHVTLK